MQVLAPIKNKTNKKKQLGILEKSHKNNLSLLSK